MAAAIGAWPSIAPIFCRSQRWRESEVVALDGKAIMERTRAVKSPEEVRAFVASLRTTEAAIGELKAALAPGMSEQAALAVLLAGSIRRGGEYPETRLLTSGPRTNPWFQETSDRIMAKGELLSFDTDMIGPMGFYTDLSRSFLVGDGRPSDAQRRLYDLARRQLAHNIGLLRAGTSFVELSEKSFQLPESCLPNRYADIAHGCGLGVEYPLIWYAEDAEWGAYDGRLEAGHDRLRRELYRRGRRGRGRQAGGAGADHRRRAGGAVELSARGFLRVTGA